MAKTQKAKEIKYNIDITSAAYQSGRQAYIDDSECPYISEYGMNNERYLFFMGYYDEKLLKFAHIKEMELPVVQKSRTSKEDDCDSR